mgnify:CR=1
KLTGTRIRFELRNAENPYDKKKTSRKGEGDKGALLVPGADSDVTFPWLGRRDFCVRGSVCETGDDSVTGFQSRRGSYDSFFSRNLYDCEAAVQSGSWAQRLKLRCSLFQTVM